MYARIIAGAMAAVVVATGLVIVNRTRPVPAARQDDAIANSRAFLKEQLQRRVDAAGNDAADIPFSLQRTFDKCEAIAKDALRRELGTIDKQRHPTADEARWRIFKNEHGHWHVYGFATPLYSSNRHKFSIQLSDHFDVLCVRIDGVVEAGDEKNCIQVDGF